MSDFKNSTVEIIQERLREALRPTVLNLEDRSALHETHPGAIAGGHYDLFIVSDAFIAKSAVQRHQMIYQALDGLIGNGIHALSIRAKTPEEHP